LFNVAGAVSLLSTKRLTFISELTSTNLAIVPAFILAGLRVLALVVVANMKQKGKKFFYS
jgi:hypothetical protein